MDTAVSLADSCSRGAQTLNVWRSVLFQSFIKEGILKKLSRKEMQPRMFYLVSEARRE